jgi:hypothetical protein
MTLPITHETAASIAYAHAEIVAARKLIAELDKAKAGRVEPDFRDAFGRRARGLQLGVPSGENGMRLFDVSPDLAHYVIDAHIGKMEARIAEFCAVARMEMDGVK